MIYDYDIEHGATCTVCRTEDDVVMDEDGDMICTDCLFERTCEEMFGDADCNDEEDYF